MQRSLLFALFGSCLLVGSSGVCHADAEPRHAYALVIGSNDGGQSQKPLRYAEDDARRVSHMLQTVGRFNPKHITTLLKPSRSTLLGTLAQLKHTLQHATNGPSMFMFYYSGHAQAKELHLGDDALPLAELRETLAGFPTGLTLVVLDACQSGAFSRIKGIEPAADFSFNSAESLNARGLAVMASSSGSELSQESEHLKAGFFTHHLLMALRGAGDHDHDGRVTLAESYQYAYHRTLASTASTPVGKQHVTLETALAGKGDVVLSYPSKADAQLRLDASLNASVIVQQASSSNIVAELHKARGSALQLALPVGEYVIIVRDKQTIHRCETQLSKHQVTTLRLAACEQIDPESVQTKGGGWVTGRRWDVEIGVGFGGTHTDAYTDRLEDFGYEPEDALFDDIGLRAALSVLTPIWAEPMASWLMPYLSVGLQISNLGDNAYTRKFILQGEEQSSQFDWWSFGVHALLRGSLGLWNDALTPFVQVGIGPGFAQTNMRTTRPGLELEDGQFFVGYSLLGGLGLNLSPVGPLGLFFNVNYVYAPVIDNLIGDDHDVGGLQVLLGLRASLGGSL